MSVAVFLPFATSLLRVETIPSAIQTVASPVSFWPALPEAVPILRRFLSSLSTTTTAGNDSALAAPAASRSQPTTSPQE